MRKTLWTFLLALIALGALAQTMPEQEVRKALGGVVDKAVRLTTKNGTYLAAVWREYKGGDPFALLLKRTSSSYALLLRTEVATTGTGEWLGEIRLLDLNKDGFPELYLTMQSCGAVVCGPPEVVFYDLSSKKKWELYVDGPVVEYPQDLLQPKYKPFLDFLGQQVALLAPKRPSDPLGDWRSEYGAFSEGRVRFVKLRPKYAPLSACPTDPERAGSIASQVKVGDLEVISYFKGDVVARDLKAKRCFRVFQPKDVYGWIETIKVLSPRKIALISNADPEDVVYFDPVALTLERGP